MVFEDVLQDAGEDAGIGLQTVDQPVEEAEELIAAAALMSLAAERAVRKALRFERRFCARIDGVGRGFVLAQRQAVAVLGERVFREALIPIFGTLPGLWALVPEAYFEDAVRFMQVPAAGGLHDKIYAYRNAMANIEENLQAAKQSGVKVCLICGYNVQRTPLVTLWRSTSDGTVDTKYASLGATCGDVKETLDEAYIQALPTRAYLSADHMIDASTCALPECTWFVRDWLHCNGNAGIDALFDLVMTSDEVSVRSFAQFPQFLEVDDDADTVRPVTGAPNAWQRWKTSPTYLNFIRWLVSTVQALFARIRTFF